MEEGCSSLQQIHPVWRDLRSAYPVEQERADWYAEESAKETEVPTSAEAAADKETEIQENETESAPETEKESNKPEKELSETALEKKEAEKDDSAEEQSEKEK